MINVIASGYFNPLHKGHIDYLKEAKKLGNNLIVIVANDKQVKLKGSKVFQDENERMLIVSSLKFVDEVVLSLNTEDTHCDKSLDDIKADIFAKGGDRTSVENLPEAEVKACERNGIKIVFGVGGNKTQSSSWLK